MRLPWPAVGAGVLAVALGAAGLIRGAVPQSAAAGPAPSAAGPIAVTGAYVRAPVPPTKTAAAYFTVYNTTGKDDRLVSIETGAGASASLHHYAADGSMVGDATGLVVPAHGSVTLSTGKEHVMIEHLFGTLQPGQTVNLELDFQDAGAVDVVAPVLAAGAPPPGGAVEPSDHAHMTEHDHPSGAHS